MVPMVMSPLMVRDSPNDTDHDIAEIPYKLHQGHHDPREELGFPHAMVQILVDGIKMIFGLVTAIVGNDDIVAHYRFLQHNLKLWQGCPVVA